MAKDQFEQWVDAGCPDELTIAKDCTPRKPIAPQAPLRILSYRDMLAMPDPSWLVEGLIQERTSALLYGKSNSFKSFLAIDIACSIATADDQAGRYWHGHDIPIEGDVLYVATEGSRGVAKQRIPGWYEAHGIPEDEQYAVSLYPEEIALDDDKAVTDLIRSCSIFNFEQGNSDDWLDPAFGYKLIVIDIFGASMMGPETSDETARAWVRNINRIMREMKCAVLTVAHTGWADQTRARMHTHFWGSFDTRLIAEGDKDNLTTVLKVERHKDADSAGEWGFRMDKVEMQNGLTTLVPRMCDEVQKTKKRRVSGRPAIALQALSEALIDHGKRVAGPNFPSCPVVTLDQWKTMCKRHGMTDSNNPDSERKAFNRAKEALQNKGIIKQFDNHVWKVPDHE